MGVNILEGNKADRMASALENIVDTIADNYVLYDAIETGVTGHAGLTKMKIILNHCNITIKLFSTFKYFIFCY